MRRETLYSSTKRILDDLKDTGVIDFINDVMDKYRGNQEKNEGVLKNRLTVFRKYTLATDTYTDDEKHICNILKIDSLSKTEWWDDLDAENDLGNIFHMQQNIIFTITQLPKFLILIEQDYIQSIKHNDNVMPEELKGKLLLSILIVENENQFSSPIRLTKALESINNLYSVCAKLENENENDLIVLACDSGSDKSFDFLGLAKVTEQVKDIIVTIWDKRVFHRQKHVSESLSLITESLPILEKINTMQENKSLSPEEAELLKRQVIKGATQFIEAGITIPELNEVSGHNPKQLLMPSPKLLVSPWNKSDEPDKIDNELIINKDAELSDKELKQLKDLKKKQKKLKKKKKTDKKI